MKSTDDLDLFIPGMEIEVKEDEPMPESFEEATKEEISDVLKAFKKRSKEEAAQKALNISTDFWFAAYFSSQAQRDKFLLALDLLDKMDADGQYICGEDLAKACKVKMPQEVISIPKAFRKPANIDDLILDM